ncbi:MAG: lanthionine synthetase LanC family protein [Oligoflexus sp.]
MSNLDGMDRGRDPFLVQWCHGSPGMIISLNNIPVGYSETFDDLMFKAGETIWQAGPLTKGIGLCHGADGNEYAFLKLFTRSKNELWLDRARRFAMYGLDQMNDRHTLWTGDIGFACYLHSCLSVDDGFPLLDFV